MQGAAALLRQPRGLQCQCGFSPATLKACVGSQTLRWPVAEHAPAHGGRSPPEGLATA